MLKEEKKYQPLIQPEISWSSKNNGLEAEMIVQPLSAGFGVTLGNSLRRVMLSFIEGSAITSVVIKGVVHEYSVLEGVVEDVMQILLALKQVRVKNKTGKPGVLSLVKKGPGAVLAQDITSDDHLEVLNKDLHIATLASNGALDISMQVDVGRGYAFAQWPSGKKNQEDGRIYIDALFSPVLRVSYTVEKTRVGDNIDYDKLIMKIVTDGSVTPKECLDYSASVINSHCSFLLQPGKEYISFGLGEGSPVSKAALPSEAVVSIESPVSGVPVDVFTKTIDELELSVRAQNCLEGADIKSVLDLVNLNEEEALKIKNFGRKTLKEVKDVLSKLELRLGMNIKTHDLKKARKENSTINIDRFG